ncbi:MAG TPA: hypothetical protein VJP77_07200 [Planctomycetota bacterium]|nr:hypothetical protein [Planctomycetota bacterium]
MALLPLLASFQLAAGGGGPALELTHSAPWLDNVFWVRLDGLDTQDVFAGGPFWLWVSPSAAALPTPFGLVELDPATAQLLVTGHAPFGSDEVSLPFLLPPDPGLAEAEVHLQAFALTTQVPEGLLLSNAAHLRLLGSRVHSQQHRIQDFGGPSEHRLAVFSAEALQPLFELPLGGVPRGARGLELSPDARSTAFRYATTVGPFGIDATAGRVLRFETFFGLRANEVPLVTRGAWVEAPWGDAWLVYGNDPAHGPGWDLWSLPYDPGLPPIPLGVGGGVGPMVADLAGDAAWIPDAAAPAGELRMKRVSLTTGATLASVLVGSAPQSELLWAELVGERLLVGTRAPATGPGQNFALLAWVDTAIAPGTLHTLALERDITRYDGRLTATGDLLVWGWFNFGFAAISVVPFLVDPAQPAAPVTGTQPPMFNSPTSVVDLGTPIWVFDKCCDDPPDDGGLAYLLLLDPLTGSLVPNGPPGLPPPILSGSQSLYVSMAATRDFAGHQVVVGSSSLAVFPFSFAPDQLLRIDPLTGAQVEVATDFWANEWLGGVSVP